MILYFVDSTCIPCYYSFLIRDNSIVFVYVYFLPFMVNLQKMVDNLVTKTLYEVLKIAKIVDHQLTIRVFSKKVPSVGSCTHLSSTGHLVSFLKEHKFKNSFKDLNFILAGILRIFYFYINLFKI